ncbi:hypothetical protein A9Q99_09105 [Gammaproteobacteria bacterium 45_16_T64]|nr:hypothetical protein A9Q99_09105 [Gammaproteobacteria bacterium 45_16_T64]
MNYPMDTLRSKASRCKQLTLINVAILLAVYALQFLWAAPEAHATNNNPQWIMLAIYIVPLLLFVPGIYSGKARTYAWFCFILMIYFCGSVISSFAVPHPLGYLGIAQSITICLLFITAMYAAKWFGLIANNGISNRKKKNSDDSQE